MRILLAILLLSTATLAGCASDVPVDDDGLPDDTAEPTLTPSTDVTALIDEAEELGIPPITLNESVVDAAVDMTGDLYEPTMEVCDDGSIYITGHTIAVDTTGAPVFGSHDDGESWEQLPWFMDQQMPEPVHGATPPVSDEIFLACGDDGWLYGSDITLLSYPVNAWSGHGTMHEYWNFNAYDETLVAQHAAADGSNNCVPVPAKDRPWSAYNNGTLLLTSNPAGGPNQIGVVDVPFATPTPWSMGTTLDGIEWNLCAGPGGSIPGVPDISSDGLFAAPQKSSGSLWLTLGHKSDVMDVRNVELFPSASGGEITSHYGHAAFDAKDTLFVGITRNTEPDENGTRGGRMTFAVSTDDGDSFQVEDFDTGPGPLRHFYMDPNDFGPGALVVWAKDGETTRLNDDGEEVVAAWDWYMGHLFVNETGAPVLTNAFLVIDEGLRPSAHVTGAAVGPDGRAYTAMYTTRSGTPAAPTTPMSVYIQTSGPTMPVSANVTAASMA